MARELHDIAAHHLSGIALMAGAADRQIDSDPEAAHRSVRQVRTQTRAVLDDLRRLVGLLRENTGSAERSVETLGTIADLVEDKRAAGLAVQLRVSSSLTGRPLGEDVGPLAQLVAYRMVQESLANAASHARGAACVVEVDDADPAAVTVTVTNAASPDPATPSGAGGFGLIGMRERADIVGAQLRYGATTDGGWEVRLRLPREDAPATRPEGQETAG